MSPKESRIYQTAGSLFINYRRDSLAADIAQDNEKQAEEDAELAIEHSFMFHDKLQQEFKDRRPKKVAGLNGNVNGAGLDPDVP